MLIAVGNEHEATFHFLSPLFLFFFLKISLLEMLIAFGNEHLKTMLMKNSGVWTELSLEPGFPASFAKPALDPPASSPPLIQG